MHRARPFGSLFNKQQHFKLMHCKPRQLPPNQSRHCTKQGVIIVVAGRKYFNIMCCCSCGWLCRSVMWTQMKMGLKDS